VTGPFSPSYHPDFQCVPTLICQFAVLVSVLYISSASACAEVPAAVGELAMDRRHQDSVEDTGCDFIPLVVETFGVWSPFALCMLQVIANCTTANVDLEEKNLHVLHMD